MSAQQKNPKRYLREFQGTELTPQVMQEMLDCLPPRPQSDDKMNLYELAVKCQIERFQKEACAVFTMYEEQEGEGDRIVGYILWGPCQIDERGMRAQERYRLFSPLCPI